MQLKAMDGSVDCAVVVVVIDQLKETVKMKTEMFPAPSLEERRDNEAHLSGEVLLLLHNIQEAFSLLPLSLSLCSCQVSLTHLADISPDL